MLSCREASRLLSDRLDRPLRTGERLGLQLHLALCRACSLAEKQFAFLRKAISQLGKQESGDSARK